MCPERLNREALIVRFYSEYNGKVRNYIRSRINDTDVADDLAQDVWCRLLEIDTDLIPETLPALIYRITHAAVTDYLRRYYARIRNGVALADVDTDIIADSVSPEAEYIAAELSAFEQRRVDGLPPQRRIIYTMSRFMDMAPAQIADSLDLSVRTVENHLRMGRHEVRSFITAIA